MTPTFNDPTPSGVAGPPPPLWAIRGPENADNYRIKVGRFKERFYRDPLPADDAWPEDDDKASYPAVSTIKGASGSDWSYTTLKRIAKAPDLAAIAATGFFERYERMKVINSLDLSAAQRRGTNVHTYAEYLSYGLPCPLSVNDEGGNYFPCVDQLFADLNPQLHAAEFVCIHRTLNGVGYGGTSDGIYEIDGKFYMVDWKSRGEDSDHDCYPEEAGQLGGYCGAEYVIVHDDDPANKHGAKRMGMPELEGGLIISIKPDSYEVYPVDIPKAIEHFQAQHAWWLARRTEGQTSGHKWAPRRAVAQVDAAADSDQEQEVNSIAAISGLDPDEVRRELLYARHAKLTKAQQDEFATRILNYDASDLDAVEGLIDSIIDPPKIIDIARARMDKDRERAAARRLSDEGGEATPDDLKLFDLRWELGLTTPGKNWVGRIVNEADQANASFRLSALNSQRRADLYCALTEWATVDAFDWNDDAPFLAVVLAAVNDSGEVGAENSTTVGEIVGRLTTKQAAVLRAAVTKIAVQTDDEQATTSEG
jgi:hypothetical protein